MNGGRDLALVGRDRELDLLTGYAQKARAGSGQAVLLRGPAGIGKTSLLHAALARITPLANRTLTARCRESGAGAYAAVRELFEPLRLTQNGGAALLDGSARHALPAIEPDLHDPAASINAYAVLHGLHWLTAGLTADGLLVLAVDDVQWCDDPSLRWLAFLLRRAEDLPLLLLLTQRTGRDAPVAEVFGEIAELPICHPMDLPALTPDTIGELLCRVLGGPSDPAFVTRCGQLTGGNPLLLGRLLARLVAHDGDRTDPAVLEDTGRAVAARSALDRLPEHMLAVARAIAVLPGEQVELIAALAGAHHRTATGAIIELRRRDLLLEEDELGGGPEFSHDTVRQTVLAGTPPAELDQLRERAATLLNDARRPAEEVAVLLVQLPGAPQPWMCDVLREAASYAEHRGAPRMAANYLERVLALDDTDVVVLAQLARVLSLIEPHAALRHLERGLELLDDPRRRVPLVSQYALTSLRAQNAVRAYELACAELDALEGVLGPNPDIADRALRSVLESAVLAAGIDEKANVAKVGERFANRRTPAGDTAEERQLLAGLALLGSLQARPAERMAAQAKRALKMNEIEFGGWTLIGAIHTLYLADDTDDVLELLDVLIRHIQAAGVAWTYCLVTAMRAIVHHWNGDLVEALADAQSCYDLVVQEKWSTVVTLPQVALALVLTDLGEADRAEEVLGGITRERFDEFTMEYHYFLMARARTHEALGETDKALEVLQRCAESLAEGHIDNPVLAPWWFDAAELLAEAGRYDEAVRVAEHGSELAQRWGTPRARGMALTARGVATPGPQGIRLLTEAVRLLATSPAKWEHARAEYLLGRALLREGDPEAARKRLRSSLDRSVLLRHRRQVTLSSAALLEAGGRLRRGYDSPADSLTGSERRVATRAANGETNREIAESLFLTVRTVELHLTSAYRKLGVRGRADLADALAGVVR